MLRGLPSGTISLLLATGMFGTDPAPEGAEAEIAAGTGKYEYVAGGCGAPMYRYAVRQYPLHAGFRYRSSSGFTAAVEGAYSPGVVVSGQQTNIESPAGPPPDLGKSKYDAYAVARIGYHFDYGGLELGGGGLVSDWKQHDSPLTPSGTLWLGKPDWIYAWGGYISGPYSGWLPPVAVGLGISRSSFRLSAGWTLRDGPTLGGDLDLGRGVWAGSSLRVLDGRDWTGLVHLSCRFELFPDPPRYLDASTWQRFASRPAASYRSTDGMPDEKRSPRRSQGGRRSPRWRAARCRGSAEHGRSASRP